MAESFNSTLVQLKDALSNCPFGCYTSFNSTLVQLKEEPTKEPERRQTSFNSTLVQLKARTGIISNPTNLVSILP